ncbi:MAG: DEAD/DEAH box helicase, partial [Candidatus Firestonebacteria bacterium]|nr:DEAD/DEAH box helicase [Candidatus Firestonebacteria bacterium]
MGEYEVLKVTRGQLTVSGTDQIYFEVSLADKFEALCRIIDIEEEFYGLIFCRTKIDVDQVANHLIERGYDADALHGDMSQNMREKILGKFKKHMINILVATDVAARGIDIHDLSHVINYSLPQDPESYVHRIGRTGRAGKSGNAITFITPSEYRKLQFISREAKTDIRRAKLPNVKDVIKTKKNRIKLELEDIIKLHLKSEYLEMTKELIESNKPEDIIAALIQYSFHDELDEKKYVEIEDAVIDTKGKTRLFVTQGKQDGLTTRKLIDFIKNKCNVRSEEIGNIQILDRFSFVSLPFHEAEVVLSYFIKEKRKSGFFITKAKKARK